MEYVPFSRLNLKSPLKSDEVPWFVSLTRIVAPGKASWFLLTIFPKTENFCAFVSTLTNKNKKKVIFFILNTF